jgi:hypothetical protein
MTNEEKQQYISMVSGIIEKQAVILGPAIALNRARNVKEIQFSSAGAVVDISGEPMTVVEKLVDEYVALSGLIVKNTLRGVFEKYAAPVAGGKK